MIQESSSEAGYRRILKLECFEKYLEFFVSCAGARSPKELSAAAYLALHQPVDKWFVENELGREIGDAEFKQWQGRFELRPETGCDIELAPIETWLAARSPGRLVLFAPAGPKILEGWFEPEDGPPYTLRSEHIAQLKPFLGKASLACQAFPREVFVPRLSADLLPAFLFRSLSSEYSICRD